MAQVCIHWTYGRGEIQEMTAAGTAITGYICTALFLAQVTQRMISTIQRALYYTYKHRLVVSCEIKYMNG